MPATATVGVWCRSGLSVHLNNVHVTGARIQFGADVSHLGTSSNTDGEVIGGGLGVLILGDSKDASSSSASEPGPDSELGAVTPVAAGEPHGIFGVSITVHQCVFQHVAIQTGELRPVHTA